MSEIPEIYFEKTSDEKLVIGLSGAWKMSGRVPSFRKTQQQIEQDGGIRRIVFQTASLRGWDSSLVVFMMKIVQYCMQNNIEIEMSSLPRGVEKLIELASPERQRKDIHRSGQPKPFFFGIGEAAMRFLGASREMFAFIGEAFVAFKKFLQGKANFQYSDLFSIMQETGAQSFPIVSLISVLVGLILAFVGAIQLRLFGAELYVADIVGIGMVRVMGAIMTGIIMAGRTGASFAAQLGTMQVNEEIDALRTLGVPPMEFLVLPRMLALTLMMPLLCIYADLMGILGGMFVGVTMLDLNAMEYYHQTKSAITLTHLWVGLFHSVVFGVLVSLSGCLRGMQCGRSASEVGRATTSAVVTSIVGIIVATAVITFSCEVLGI